MSDQGDLFGPSASTPPASAQEETLEAMAEWIRSDPKPWRHFERIALAEIAGGRARLGAKAICEKIRWETRGEKDAAGVKVRNAFTAYLARLSELLHPEHAGIFRRAKTPSANRRAKGRKWHVGQVPPPESVTEARVERRLAELARELKR